ncbi:MAG TPA: hypothetical protein VMZ25_03745 [Terriglobales bacterium]|nr:hypothetical protein [Terriglobales bacterium]
MRLPSLLFIASALAVSLAAQNSPSSSTIAHVSLTTAEIADVSSSKETQLAPAKETAISLALPARISQRCGTQAAVSTVCRFNWRPALLQSIQFLAIQHAMNTPTYHGTLQGPFFRDWFRSVKAYRYTRWSDDDPFLVDYIGHPMMGAVVGRIQVQNDPRGMSLEFGRSKNYWKSRAKAFGFAAVYTAQWELGPVSETSIGNIGSFEYYSPSAHHLSNGTGAVDLVMTPLGGTAWLVGEDLLDKYAIARLERVSNQKLWLLSISVLNPTRSVANLLRMKTPWHRDTRTVGGPR